MPKKIIITFVCALLAIAQMSFASDLEQALSDQNLKAEISNAINDAEGKTNLRSILFINAAKDNDIDGVKRWLKLGADINYQENVTKNTALHIASKNNFKSIIDFLLSRKDIRLELKNSEFKTPLMLASEYGHTVAFIKLLNKGAYINAREDLFLQNALHLAIWNNQIDTALYIIDNTKIDLKHKSSKYLVYDTALSLCAISPEGDYQYKKGDRSAIIRALLNKGLNINERQNSKGETALMLAVKHNNLPAIFELLKHKDINVNIPDLPFGNNVMFYIQDVPAFLALYSKKANIHKPNYYEATALMFAARRSNAEIVQKFIDFHADINATDMYGENALIYALKGDCDPKVIKVLVDNNIDTKVKDKNGLGLISMTQNNPKCQQEKVLPIVYKVDD